MSLTKTIYSVKDVKSSFGHPHLAASNPEAIRQFQVAVNQDPNGLYKTHSSDFVLFKIGTINLDTGVITPDEVPTLICTATDLLQ